MKSITTVYFFPQDHAGNETGEAIPVNIGRDGTADLSKLPNKLRATLEFFGVPDQYHVNVVFPASGTLFLENLVRSTNPFLRFRTTPSPINSYVNGSTQRTKRHSTKS